MQKNSEFILSDEIFKHNMNIFVDKRSKAFSSLGVYSPKNVEILSSKTGLPVLKKDGKAIHSLYDPIKEAESKLKNVDLEFVKYIVVFGFGMGYLIEKIHEIAPQAKIMVFEPDLDILKVSFSLKKFNFKEQEIIIHTTTEDFHSNCFTAYRTNEPITVITDPVWKRNHPELVKDLQKELEQFVVYSKIAENTAVLRLRTWINYLLENLPSHSQRPAFSGLQNKFMHKTAVICSAGPSLDKNLHLLKGVEDKIIIIAVNTAYKALLKQGIIPHFVIAIESFNINSLFEGVDTTQTTLLAPITGNPAIFELPFKRIISFVDNYPVYSAWLSSKTPEESFLDMGGSVACAAYSFAKYLGVETITLIGQDLAYTEGRMYAKGTNFENITLDFNKDAGKIKMKNLESKEKIYKDTGKSHNLKSEVELKMIEGWYGELVPTSEDFKFFKVWFESAARLAKLEGIRVVNATEGGAKINGFEHIPLKQILEETASKNIEPHNVEAVLQNLKPISGYYSKLSSVYDDLSDSLMKIIRISGDAIGRANILLSKINPENSDFHKKVRELEKIEKKMNKTSKKIPLLQGYVKELILNLKTNPKGVVDLPPQEAWKINLTQSKLISEAVRDSAFALKSKVDEFRKRFFK